MARPGETNVDTILLAKLPEITKAVIEGIEAVF